MKSMSCSHSFMMIAIILSGCVPISATVIPEQSNPQSPTSTFAQLTSTPVLISTETLASTPLATMEPLQAKQAISKLLREDVNCEAPCFWGIMPGRTTLIEAKSVFTHLGIEVKSTTFEGKDFHGIEYIFDSGLSISVILTTQNEIVENLRVKILPEKQKEGIPREWLVYSPESLINRYGSPLEASFILDWGPRSFFDMVLQFEEVDMIVEYSGYELVPRQKGSPQVCPLTAQFDYIGLWMGRNPVYPPADGIPLDTATSLTMEKFSKLMTGDPDIACFTLRGEAFP